ncbi:MAG: DUF1376 domain-containing protein [Rickettsiales bacterium]
MPAPAYMRFFPALYCKDTMNLSMEEQGTYMRLLCLMWANGGYIENNDAYISKALPINLNKWLKVKHAILPFLEEHSPGYLTQKKLLSEYAFSTGDKKGNKLDAMVVAPLAAPPTTHPAAPPAAGGVAPPTDHFAPQKAANAKRQQIQRFEPVPRGGVAHALARALDQSRSRSDLNKASRLLEDGDPVACGKPDHDAIATRFVAEAILAFEKHGLHPPSDYSVVNGWVTNCCDPMDHILPAITSCLGRISKATDPPQSWRYFAHEVYGRKKKTNREQNDG